MKISEAKVTGEHLARHVSNGEIDSAVSILNPILADRTQFSALNRIGSSLVDPPLENIYTFLDRLAIDRYMGGWVVIGSALGTQLDRDFDGALNRCKKYIIQSDIWYGADILGERVPGPALFSDFKSAINFLTPWRIDSNRGCGALSVSAPTIGQRNPGGLINTHKQLLNY